MSVDKRVAGLTYLLVDARNWSIMKPELVGRINNSQTDIGLDIETTNVNCHDGLKQLMKMADDGRQGNKKLVFDLPRSVMTGFSMFFDGDEINKPLGIYVNLNHADVENRIPWSEAKELIDAKVRIKSGGKARWRIHNASFEIAMYQAIYGLDLGEDDYYCTLQLAVTVMNSDTYEPSDLANLDLSPAYPIIKESIRAFASFDRNKLTNEQETLLSGFCGKSSVAAHSWNGLVKSMNTGFGLKVLTKRFFKYEQVGYNDLLKYYGVEHMGDLTGEQTLAYGVDDAYWCYKLFNALVGFAVGRDNASCLTTYQTQENPICHIFAMNWVHGAKIDYKAVARYRDSEREKCAIAVRQIKQAIRELLPFPEAPHEKLEKYESWYKDGKGQKYRKKLMDFANLPDDVDSFKQVYQIRGAITNAWAEEKGLKESNGVNLSHYMPVRTLFYDLCGMGVVMSQGKIQSDADTRTYLINLKAKRIVEELEIDVECPAVIASAGLPASAVRVKPEDYYKIAAVAANPVIRALVLTGELAKLDQTNKLYLTPYTRMIDPDTGKMHPQLTSILNTRRTACSNPNGQQLAKYSGSAYIRSLYEPDSDDEVLVSADWSSVELVIAAERSGDEAMCDAFSIIPFKDLHSMAAAGVLEMSLEEFKDLPNKKELRTDIGKGSNFGVIYAGNMNPVAQRMGWSSEKMWEATEAYWATFFGLKKWRDAQVETVVRQGYVELMDNTRRYRYEATQNWTIRMLQKFDTFNSEGVMNFAREALRRISARSKNQAINALIQGECATLAKRCMIRMREEVRKAGLRARFWLLVHDELIYSVHKDDLAEFLVLFKRVMCTHPDLFKVCKVDSTLSIGLNFRPWDKECQHGQIELSELQKLPVIDAEQYGKPMREGQLPMLVEYLFAERAKYRESVA